MKITSGLILGLISKYLPKTHKNSLQNLLKQIFDIFEIRPKTTSKATISRALRGGSLHQFISEQDIKYIKTEYSKHHIKYYEILQTEVLCHISDDNLLMLTLELLSILASDTSIPGDTKFRINYDQYLPQENIIKQLPPPEINVVIFITDLLILFLDKKNKATELYEGNEVNISNIINTHKFMVHSYTVIFPNSCNNNKKENKSKSYIDSYIATCQNKCNFCFDVTSTPKQIIENLIPQKWNSEFFIDKSERIFFYDLDKIYIEGDICSGKTALMHQLFSQELNNYHYSYQIPIYLNLCNYTSYFNSLLPFIEKEVNQIAPTINSSETKNMISNNKCLFIIDGLDAACTTNIIHCLSAFISQNPQHKYIIAGRESFSSLYYLKNLNFINFKIQQNSTIDKIYKDFLGNTSKSMLYNWDLFTFSYTKYEEFTKSRILQRQNKTGLNNKELVYLLSMLICSTYIKTIESDISINYIDIDNFLSSYYIPDCYRNKINSADFLFDISFNIPALSQTHIHPLCPYKMLMAQTLVTLDPESNFYKNLIDKIIRNNDFIIFEYARNFDEYVFTHSILATLYSTNKTYSTREMIIRSLCPTLHITEIAENQICFDVTFANNYNLTNYIEDVTIKDISLFIKNLFNTNREFKDCILSGNLNNSTSNDKKLTFIVQTQNQTMLILNRLIDYYKLNSLNSDKLVNPLFENSDLQTNPFMKMEQFILSLI